MSYRTVVLILTTLTSIGLLACASLTAPTPTTTPETDSLALECEVERLLHEHDHFSHWHGLMSDAPPPATGIEAEPVQCVELREKFPTEYEQLVGNVITGTFTLYDDDFYVVTRDGPSKGDCWGQGGYDDIGIGLDVIIKDGTGTIIAKDELWPGKKTDRNECTFPFYVSGVPSADFYEIEVGRRGSLVFSRSEMDYNGWQAHLQLGR